MLHQKNVEGVRTMMSEIEHDRSGGVTGQRLRSALLLNKIKALIKKVSVMNKVRSRLSLDVGKMKTSYV